MYLLRFCRNHQTMYSIKLNSFFPIISKRYNVFFRSSFRLLSDKKVEPAEIPTTEAPSYEKPRHATRSDYQSKIKSSRIGREADETTGVIPTNMQRRFLLITYMYSSRSEQPLYVPHQTMKRMHDRMRVGCAVFAMFIFFAIFYIFELQTSKKIERDRASGKVVTRMA